LDVINVVPNPYNAFSSYESSQIDQRVKIINLPVKCTISIYNLNGTLVRQYDRDDNTITSLDWDLKNSKNVPIASGVYLIHINAPGIGEKTLKWFGVLRPIDLDSF
jgi:flagellar hook assembly protein FlgD